MRVYYFTSALHALKNIENNEIRVSRIAELNDPYEFYVHVTRGGQTASPEQRDGMKGWCHEKFGLVCFSRRTGDSVHWAHYGDKHKGICLGYEIKNEMLHKVRYRNKPPSVEVALSTAQTSSMLKEYAAATLTKYKNWAYEKEFRHIVDLSSSEVSTREIKGGQHTFLDTSSIFKLEKIILGTYCLVTVKELQSTLQARFGVKIMKSKISLTDYKIVNSWNHWRNCNT